MNGNLYVLLSLAEGIVSFLPAAGTAAVRRSKSIVRRTSHLRAVLIGVVTATVHGMRTARRRSRTVPNAAVAGEGLSP